jgi:hypothetical protein
VDPISGTERTTAYRQGNSQQWERQRQAQRRRNLLQRLGQALEKNNVAECHQALAALSDDEFFSNHAIAPDFDQLEKAVAARDWPTAQQALARLQAQGEEPATPAPRVAADDDLREVLSTKDELDSHGKLDVTA